MDFFGWGSAAGAAVAAMVQGLHRCWRLRLSALLFFFGEFPGSNLGNTLASVKDDSVLKLPVVSEHTQHFCEME